jgi:hypothetical protein
MRVKWFPKHVTDELSAYCHAVLSEAEMRRVEQHLAHCSRCRREYETIQRGVLWAAQLRQVQTPDSLWSAVVEKIEAAKKPAIIFPSWKSGLAATALALIALSGWWWLKREPPHKPVVAQHETPTRTTPAPTGAPPASPTATDKPKPKLTATPELALRNLTLPAWEVASVTGTPRIGAEKITERGKLAVGEWLETDNASRAKIKVAEIGYVDIDPNSRVRLVRTKETEHRIALAKGKMSALIFAPPRLFIVDTPSATAVDLGCAYTLEVDEFGASLLHVTSGWVSLVRDGQESVIPAGAMCATRQGIGVGTPYFEDASAAFKTALTTIDFGQGTTVRQALGTLLAEARVQDALTLWHLLGRQFGAQTAQLRERVFDRLAELAPPPANVTRAGIIRGDRKMLELWWGEKIR